MLKTIRPAYRLAFLALALIVTAGFESCNPICANEYYVATNGNDSNPGTIGQPWKSINKGVDIYNPGDTIYIRAGTYTQTAGIYFYRSGSAAAPITFRPYPGEAVILDGSAMPALTTLVWIGCNYFTMQDFELRNATGNAIADQGGSYVTLNNMKIHDSQYSGISIGKGDLTSTHNVLVENCSVYNNCHMNDPHTLSGGWPGALVVGGGNNVTVQNSTVYQNQGEGIIFYLADHCTAAGNTSHDNYGPNIYLDNATFCTVSSNMLFCSGLTAYYRSGNPAPGIQNANEQYSISNPSHDLTIINNIFVSNNYTFYYGNYGNGGGLKNFTFANNSIYMARLENIHVDTDTHQNAVFCNNINYMSTGATQVDLPASLTGLSFSHNLWYGGNVGTAWATGDLYTDPKFVNPGTTTPTDYKVQAGSPAAGLGMTLGAVTTDFFGTARSTPMDAGACVCSAAPVNHPPVLSGAPTCNPNPALVGQNITMTASATDADNDPLTYTWTLGDGSTLTGASITKAYAAAGTFTVTVTVTDGRGGSDSKSVTVTVNNPPPPPPVNHPPVLQGAPACNPNPANVGQTVTLTATATDADNDPLTYTWTLGDGSTLVGASVTKAFSSAATFTVTVTVTDGRGGSTAASISVVVNAQTPPQNPPPVNTPPSITSAPTYAPNPAVAGQVVTFTTAATDADGNTLTYTWTLGDGTTQTGASIVKTYSSSGVYTVTVTVTDGQGGSDARTISVTVNASAQPAGPLNVSTLGMSFNLSRANSDMILVMGTVPVPAGFSPNGTQAVITIGNYQHTVTLNAQGVSKDKTFKLSAKKMVKGVTTAASNASFLLSIKRTSLFNQLSSLGLSTQDGQHTDTVNVGMTIGTYAFADTTNAAYNILGGN